MFLYGIRPRKHSEGEENASFLQVIEFEKALEREVIVEEALQKIHS